MNHLRRMIALVGGMLWLVGGISLLWAQQSGLDWIEPENLSQSGATTNPMMVVDNEGVLHVFWQDTYDEAYVYQHNVGGSWSMPVTATLPFTMTIPHLVIDNHNQMHAFWRFADGADDLSVRYSHVPVTAVTSFAAWSPVQIVADAAADLDVALDEQGELHLLFARPKETMDAPAGVYHGHTTSDGDGIHTWITPTLLFASPYFRGLKQSDASVDLVTAVSGNNSWLLAAWDNRPRKQIFFARSGNGGANWETPVEIAGPESGSGVVFPFNLRVGVKDNNVLLVWNNGQPGTSCNQFALASPDLGATWGERYLMDDLLPGTANCISQNEFIPGAHLLFLLSTVQNRRYLWAWDGSRWSSPALQSILTTFDNPETLNAVVLRCQQTMGYGADQLLVVGCEEDIRGYGDGDIWLLSRSLGDSDAWFPPPTAWGPVQSVNSSPDAYHSLALTPGMPGQMLAFWTLADGSGNAQPAVVVARESEGRWLLPETVLTIPRTTIASPLALATSSSGRLFLAWADVSGQPYLAQTNVADAHVASLWSPITEVPLPGPANSLAIAADENNKLYLAYTVAVNEGRGIYLLISADNGRTWSEPTVILDGTIAGWEVVGPVQMAVTGAGQVHILGAQQSFLGGTPQTQALYYTRSEDGGQTFLPATMMTGGHITWHGLIAADENSVHQFWRIMENQTDALQHVYSLDGGQTWSQPDLINTNPAAVAIAGHENGSVSLLLLEDAAVNERHWQDGRWTQPTGITLNDYYPPAAPDRQIAASFSPDGQLTTLFTGQMIAAEAESQISHTLHASSRVAGEAVNERPPGPTGSPALQPTVTLASASDTPTPIVVNTETDVPTPTAVPDFGGTPSDSANNSLLVGFGIGFVPAVLLTLAVFFIGVLIIKRRSR